MHYSLYNPTTDLDRLHAVLELPYIQDIYDDACREYLLNAIEVEPRKKPWAEKLLNSASSLLPEQVNTVDHEWNEGLKPQLWHKFVSHGACHWMVWPYLILAEELFPLGNWRIYETDEHSAVVDDHTGMIFDLTFAAYGVEPEAVLELIQH